MSDLSLSTIRRYLEEMGFPDLPDDQVISLRKDVIARLQKAEAPNQAAETKFKRNFDDGNIEEMLDGVESDEDEYQKYRQPSRDDERLGRLYSQKSSQRPSSARPVEAAAAVSGSEESSEEVPVFRRAPASADRPYRKAKSDLMRQEIDYGAPAASAASAASAVPKAQRSGNGCPSYVPYAPRNPQGAAQTSYSEALQPTGHTRINGLLGPHRHTLQEKKKRKADPVSNFARYQQRWLLQGPPEERKQRCFVNRAREQGYCGCFRAYE